MAKADRIYTATFNYIKDYLENTDKTNEQLEMHVFPLIYGDNELVTVRTLNDMMTLVEGNEKNLRFLIKEYEERGCETLFQEGINKMIITEHLRSTIEYYKFKLTH